MALLKFGITPLRLNNMCQKEKAFIYASIDVYIEDKQKEAQKIKNG